LPDGQRDEALELRNKLLLFRFRFRGEAQLDPALADLSLEARSNQILLPLLSVAPDEDMRVAILAAARQFHVAVMSDRADSTEGQVLSIVRHLSRDRDEPIRVAEVATALGVEFGSQYDQPITNRWVGKILRRLGIALYKRNGVATIMPGQSTRLSALFTRYGVDEISPAADSA
jgi:hypothetical protein